jgi:hypothetical protein
MLRAAGTCHSGQGENALYLSGGYYEGKTPGSAGEAVAV